MRCTWMRALRPNAEQRIAFAQPTAEVAACGTNGGGLLGEGRRPYRGLAALFVGAIREYNAALQLPLGNRREMCYREECLSLD